LKLSNCLAEANAEDETICGSTMEPATTDPDRLKKSLLVVLFIMVLNFVLMNI
jgi:hypothetical protein